MITRVNPLGHISLTNDYFSGLVAEAAKNCYGIAAMGQSSASQHSARSAAQRLPARKRRYRKPAGKGDLVITLHIKVGVWPEHRFRSRKALPTALKMKLNMQQA